MPTGTVLLFEDNNCRGVKAYGWLLDDAIGFPDRATNVYFTNDSLECDPSVIRKGLRVEFDYCTKPIRRPGYRQSAVKIRPII
jgi:hypothetical protein